MKKIAPILIVLVGLIVPWACTNQNPTGPLATYNLTATFTYTFTPTPTNWAGYTNTTTPGTSTSTPTVTATLTATSTALSHSATPTNTATSTCTLTPTSTFSVSTPVLSGSPWNTSAPPNGLAYDGTTNVYVAEGLDGNTGGSIQVFNNIGTPVATMTTNGVNTFGQPNGVACFGGNIYVVDQVNNAVYEINPTGPTLLNSLTSWTSTGAPAPSSFLGPEGIAVDGSGNVYIADTGNDYIEEFSSSLSTTPLAEFGGSGNTNGLFDNPSSLAVDGSGIIYVADASNQRIQIFSNLYAYSSQFSTGSNSDIYGITLDGSGNIYLADSGLGSQQGQVEEYSSTGALLTQGLSGNSSSSPDPVGLVFVGSNLLVSDYNNNQLYLVTP